jgi:hypothetical protein
VRDATISGNHRISDVILAHMQQVRIIYEPYPMDGPHGLDNGGPEVWTQTEKVLINTHADT